MNMKSITMKLYLITIPILTYLLIGRGNYSIAASISLFMILVQLEVIESKLNVLVAALEPPTDTEHKEGAE